MTDKPCKKCKWCDFNTKSPEESLCKHPTFTGGSYQTDPITGDKTFTAATDVHYCYSERMYYTQACGREGRLFESKAQKKKPVIEVKEEEISLNSISLKERAKILLRRVTSLF